MKLLASFALIVLFGVALVPAHAQKSKAKLRKPQPRPDSPSYRK